MKHTFLLPAVLLATTAQAQDVVFEQFTGQNGVSFEYTVREPAEFDRSEPHPVLFAFPPGEMDRKAAEWAVANLWGDAESQGGWVIVVPTAPDRGWMTHPSHHALEDLLDHLKSEYRVEGDRLHLTGYAAGARPAITYANMSNAYWQTVTVAGPSTWNRWDDRDLQRWPDRNRHIAVRILVGEHDEDGLRALEGVERIFGEADLRIGLRIIPGYGEGLESLLGGGMLEEIALNADSR